MELSVLAMSPAQTSGEYGMLASSLAAASPTAGTGVTDSTCEAKTSTFCATVLSVRENLPKAVAAKDRTLCTSAVAAASPALLL